MDPTSDSGISQVFGKVLDTVTYGLSRVIDSEYPTPWVVTDPSGYQYAVGPNGQYYMRGAPGLVPGAAAPMSSGTGLLIALAIGGIAFLALK